MGLHHQARLHIFSYSVIWALESELSKSGVQQSLGGRVAHTFDRKMISIYFHQCPKNRSHNTGPVLGEEVCHQALTTQPEASALVTNPHRSERDIYSIPCYILGNWSGNSSNADAMQA